MQKKIDIIKNIGSLNNHSGMGQVFNHIANIVLSDMEDTKAKNDEWKKRIKEDWKKTYNMPRKKKKARRKELLLDWSFACYDPFDIDSWIN